MGFHGPQEAARLLGEAVDFAPRTDLAAQKRLKGHSKIAGEFRDTEVT